ncbi:MAG: hypothetical protein GXY23_07315 [Myxococcales bacterium]|nr:hypothetical protein [Myxococcales bacterium]
MSRMAESFFAVSPMLAFPLVAMVIFGAVFLAISMRTMRTPNEVIERRRALPLEEDHHG